MPGSQKGLYRHQLQSIASGPPFHRFTGVFLLANALPRAPNAVGYARRSGASFVLQLVVSSRPPRANVTGPSLLNPEGLPGAVTREVN